MTLLLLITLIGTALAAPIEVRLHYVGAREDAAFLGVTQGLEEANLQGRFLGQRYVLDIERDARVPPAAILAAIEEKALVALAGQHPGTPVFNLSSETDALRDICLTNLLHVVPSREMKRDALAQWRKLHPGSKALAQAWHSEFKKYSAEQLSKRFFKARGQAMDDGAWAGWAAVKLLSDSVARLGAAEPKRLLGYIRTQLAFDGQKRIDMNFRPNGDAQTLQVKTRIPVGQRVWGLALTRDGRRLYCTNGVSNSVSVIDTATDKVMQTIAVGEAPWGVVIDD